MLTSFISLVLASVMWVQVPQWENDWSKCAVDVPDVGCHWYIVILTIPLVRDFPGEYPMVQRRGSP